MKQETWAKECIPYLEERGFVKIKPHEYWCVRDEMLFVISFQGKKTDIYVWYAVYPLAMPDIWPSSGFGNSSGRLPFDEKCVSIKNESEIPSAQKAIKEVVVQTLLPKFKKIVSLKKLANLLDDKTNLIGYFPLAYCHFELGQIQEGYDSLNEIMKIPYLNESVLVGQKIQRTLSVDKKCIKEHIGELRAQNIKKLKLNKCIKAYNKRMQSDCQKATPFGNR